MRTPPSHVRRVEQKLKSLATFVVRVQDELRRFGEAVELDPAEGGAVRLGFRRRDEVSTVAVEVIRLRRLRRA
jgi:hypothetical protein